MGQRLADTRSRPWCGVTPGPVPDSGSIRLRPVYVIPGGSQFNESSALGGPFQGMVPRTARATLVSEGPARRLRRHFVPAGAGWPRLPPRPEGRRHVGRGDLGESRPELDVVPLTG